MLQDLPQEVLHACPGGCVADRAGQALPDLPIPDLAARAAARADEVADLQALLLDHIAFGTPECQARSVSRTIALASLGDRHLWEDLGLPSRDSLWLVMERHFPDLVAKNRGRMRWKKFLYRELCLREQVLICRSPSCDTCPEQADCFAPETASA